MIHYVVLLMSIYYRTGFSAAYNVTVIMRYLCHAKFVIFFVLVDLFLSIHTYICCIHACIETRICIVYIILDKHISVVEDKPTEFSCTLYMFFYTDYVSQVPVT